MNKQKEKYPLLSEVEFMQIAWKSENKKQREFIDWLEKECDKRGIRYQYSSFED